jgi:hypothetical protein
VSDGSPAVATSARFIHGGRHHYSWCPRNRGKLVEMTVLRDTLAATIQIAEIAMMTSMSVSHE